MSNKKKRILNLKIDIKTITIVILLLISTTLFLRLLYIRKSYNELQKTIKSDYAIDEIIADVNNDENNDIKDEEDELGNSYMYFTLLDDKNSVILDTSYIKSSLSLSPNYLPKKMILHLMDNGKEYTSTFSINNNIKKLENNPKVITNTITNTITKTEMIIDSNDAKITYIGIGGNTQTINIPSNTIINFNGGDHGYYTSIPESITLEDKQQLDITDTIYTPDTIELNYIFNGFSYSGNTFYANYSYVNNPVDLNLKKVDQVYKDTSNKIYIPLDYLENKDTQSINLLLSPQLNRKVEVDFQCKSYVAGDVIFGCRDGSSDRRFDVFASQTNELCFRTTQVVATGDTFKSVDLAQRHKISLMFDSSKQYVSIDGVTTSVNKSPKTFTDNIYLFNRSQQSMDTSYAKGYLFGAKIWDSSTLIREFIPVKNISDNKFGLFDICSNHNKFYDGESSGNFDGNLLIEDNNTTGTIYANGTYENGSQLELTANANSGYEFVCWNDGSTDNPKTITINNTDSYYAIFKPIG